MYDGFSRFTACRTGTADLAEIEVEVTFKIDLLLKVQDDRQNLDTFESERGCRICNLQLSL